MKKLMYLSIALILAMSVPMLASASDASPSDNDFKISVDHSGAIYVNVFTQSSEVVYQGYVSNGESVNVTAPFGDTLMLSAAYDFTASLEPYFSLISSATNVWVSYACEYYQYIDPAVDDSHSLIWCNYDNGKGFQQFLLDEYPISGMGGVYDGNHVTSPIDIADVFRGGNDFKYFQIAQRINVPTNSSKMYDYQFIPKAFSLIVYLQGVSGTDANMFLVVDGGFKDIEKSIDEVKQEVTAIQGQLDNIQSDINNGFNGILTPDLDDQQAAGDFLDKVDDNKQNAADINDQLSSVSRPDPGNLRDEVNPDQYIDKDDASVQEMSGLIASVFDIDVMVRYILVLLGLGLISLVFFGKKDG